MTKVPIENFDHQVKYFWDKHTGIRPWEWKIAYSGDFLVLYFQEKFYNVEEEEIGVLNIQNKYHLDTGNLFIQSNIAYYDEGNWALYEEVQEVEEMPILWLEWIEGLFNDR